MQIADNAPSIDRWLAGEPHARKTGTWGSEGGGWRSVPVREAARWPPTLHLGLHFRAHDATYSTKGTCAAKGTIPDLVSHVGSVGAGLNFRLLLTVE